MKIVGWLDREIYRCVTPDIRTDEVIITEERIEHIRQRHPNDYERYFTLFGEMIAKPDYILMSDRANTAFVLKEMIQEGERFQMIIRLAVSGDPRDHLNSVITFLRIDEKRYRRYLRTKKILYKSE